MQLKISKMNLSKDLFCKGLSVSFSLVVIMTFLGPKAKAEYACGGAGPGERVVGRTQGGNGVASVLLCDSDPNYQEEPEDRGSDSSRYYDPKFAALQFQAASALLNLQQQAQLLQDPKYLKYLSGSWKLFPTSRLEGVISGSYCVASFFKASMDPEAKDAPVMINLSGPGGDYKGALLTFATESIPRPKTIQTITVTLIQNNDPPATVKAFNYTMPNLPFGVIAFAVPTIDAALAGIEDVQHFDVKIDGKSVAKTMWHSGLKVKDEFRKCLNGKPYSVTEIDIVPERLKKP
ncbi:hypothetical protein [Trichormus variabilis]|uniref:Uncharacterized protein n=2 Tax=Anabaena variabilis TaxID=264691 RepID=A0A3S1CQU9_ANAVA|nr:hypothetical protein [Trichormus variabilis]RUS96779.1 hypothetical protein DSM107003_21850 [Trichormus variabilis SAG 1403-4b]